MALSAPQKFLIANNGIPTQNAPAAVGGAANAYNIPALNASGQLDITMLPSGIGSDTAVITASEAIAAGSLVNVWSNTGTTPASVAARNADNSTPTKAAVGYVLTAVASGAQATVYFSGVASGLSGLMPGQQYYLGSVGALIPATALPTAAGTLTQSVGVAISATQLQIVLGPQIGN